MEELSAQEFSRLNEQEKASYLQQLLGEESTEEDFVSNSEDEDWFPLSDELPEEISDNEEIVENRDDEVEEGNDDIEEIAENPCDAEPNTSSNSEFFVAKDETKWNRTPIANQHKVAVRNIIRERSGPHRNELKYIQIALENQNRQINEIPSETVHFNNISVWTIVTYILIAFIIIAIILRYYKRKFKKPTNGNKQATQEEDQDEDEEDINPQRQNPERPRFLI
ncbi:hypothetical protein FQA39_LY06431 [Lamprigera yunnana]|nr:hypothetical protein FQA39_LY06431 [Lamprigera yunnana]